MVNMRIAARNAILGVIGFASFAANAQTAGVTEFPADIRWTGRIQALAMDASAPEALIAATDNGGIFKRTLSGWQHADTLPASEMGDVQLCEAIAIASSLIDSGIGEANTGGIWRSGDAGLTWDRPTLHRPSPGVVYSGLGVAFAPDDDCNTVYVGTESGIAVSRDGGVEFDHYDIDGMTVTVLSVVASPGGRVDIHAQDGHHRSDDWGQTWTTAIAVTDPTTGPGLPAPPGGVQDHGPATLALGPYNDEDDLVMYGASVAQDLDNSGGVHHQLFETLDGGQNWQRIEVPNKTTNRVPAVFAVPTRFDQPDDGQQYDLYWSDGFKIYRRTCDAAVTSGSPCAGGPDQWELIDIFSRTWVDDGGTYKNVSCQAGIGKCSHADGSDILFDGEGCPLFIASDGGIMERDFIVPPEGDDPWDDQPGDVSLGCGRTGLWRIEEGPAAGLNALELYGTAGQVHPAAGGGAAADTFLYFGTQDNDLWASTDNGASWGGSIIAEGAGLDVERSSTVTDPESILVTAFKCGNCANRSSSGSFSGDSPWLGPEPETVANLPTCTDNVSRDGSESPDGFCDPLAAPIILAPHVVDTGIRVQWDGAAQIVTYPDAEPGDLDAGVPVGDADVGDPVLQVARPFQLHVTLNDGSSFDPIADAVIPPPGWNLTSYDDPTVHSMRPNHRGFVSRNAAGDIVLLQPVWINCQDETDGSGGGSDGVCDSLDSGGGFIQVRRNSVIEFTLDDLTGTPTSPSWQLVEPTRQDAMGNELAVFPTAYFIVFGGGLDFGVSPSDSSRLLISEWFDQTMRRTDATGTWTAPDDPSMVQLTNLLTARGTRQYLFQDMSGSTYSQVRSVRFDPANADRILVGTENSGIISSLDGGDSWARLCKSGLVPRVTDFFFDEVNDQVWASSYGRGLWQVDPEEQQRPEFTSVPTDELVFDCGPVDLGARPEVVDSCENVDIDVTLGVESPNGSLAADCAQDPRPCGYFQRGETTLTWTAEDVYGDVTVATTVVEVQDTTPPVFEGVEDVTIGVCDLEGETVILVPPKATDACDVEVTYSAVVTASDTTTVPLSVGADYSVYLPPGNHVVQWTASDGVNTSDPVNQNLTVVPAVYANERLAVGDRTSIKDASGAGAAIANGGTNGTLIGGTGTLTGSVISVANVDIYGGAVDGSATSAGSVSVYNGGSVSNWPPNQFATVNLPAHPDLDEVVFPTPLPGYTVNTGLVPIFPGSYEYLIVNSPSEGSPPPIVGLFSGDYYFDEFTANTDSVVFQVDDTAGPVRIFVKTTMNHRAPFEKSDGSLAEVLVGYLGTNQVTLEAPFLGVALAPNAILAMGTSDATEFTGQFYGKTIEFRPDVEVACLGVSDMTVRIPGGGLMPPPPPGDCNDGDVNGTETGVDCGGGVCPTCDDGQNCMVDSDCTSGFCDGGTCQPPGSGDLTLNGQYTINADWGYGYCIDLNISNPNGVTADTWEVVLQTGQSTITQSWYGAYSPSSGQVTIVPNSTWFDQSIAPGESDTSVGFCANRQVPFSGVLPQIVSATGYP